MASGSKYPPPQHQDQQPGKEYVMNPLPQPLNPKPYNPSNKLLGKIALVTGGDSGIGRSVCLHFAMEGATVAFTYVKGIEDIDKDETIKLIKESKVPSAKDPIAISADLGYESECQRVVDEFIKEDGTIDILVNNAAVQYYSTSIEDIIEERLEKTFRSDDWPQAAVVPLILRIKFFHRGSGATFEISLTFFSSLPPIARYWTTTVLRRRRRLDLGSSPSSEAETSKNILRPLSNGALETRFLRPLHNPIQSPHPASANRLRLIPLLLQPRGSRGRTSPPQPSPPPH
ncbi:Glucose and ribitol dehydrogenase [Linum perenne]